MYRKAWGVLLVGWTMSCTPSPPRVVIPTATKAALDSLMREYELQDLVVRGRIVDARTLQPIANARVATEQDSVALSSPDGSYELRLPMRTRSQLDATAAGYLPDLDRQYGDCDRFGTEFSAGSPVPKCDVVRDFYLHRIRPRVDGSLSECVIEGRVVAKAYGVGLETYIEIDSLNPVRSDSLGYFSFESVPSGERSIEVMAAYQVPPLRLEIGCKENEPFDSLFLYVPVMPPIR